MRALWIAGRRRRPGGVFSNRGATGAPPAASVPRGPMDAFAKLKAVYYADANKKRRRA